MDKFIHDFIIRYNNEDKKTIGEFLLLESIKLNKIDEKYLFDMFKSDINLISFENLAYYNLIELYQYKLMYQKCTNKCKCLINSLNNTNQTLFILNNNECFYSINYVLKIINNNNKTIFDKIIEKIDKFKLDDNILLLLNNLNNLNFQLIIIFLETVINHCDVDIFLNEKYTKNILNNLSDINIINMNKVIKFFFCNKKISFTKKIIDINNEKYNIYELLYENNVNINIINNSPTSDLIDVKAYKSNDMIFFKYCVENNCKKNIILIDEVIKNNDIETLTFLLHKNYIYDPDINNIDLIKTSKIFLLLLTKINCSKIQNFIVKILNKYMSNDDSVIIFQDKNIKIDDIFNNEIINNINEELITMLISNNKYSCVCKILDIYNIINKNTVDKNNIYFNLIKHYNVVYDKYIFVRENKNNNLITLFASMYNEILFARLLNYDFLIDTDCILYVCKNKNLLNLNLLLEKISDTYFFFFYKIKPDYQNSLCHYFTNDNSINELLNKYNYIFSDNDAILQYLLSHMNEYNIDLYDEIFLYYNKNVKPKILFL